HMLAKRAGDFGLSSSETIAIMRGWNNSNQPPFSERDLDAIVENAYRYRRSEIGSDPSRPRSAPPPIKALAKTRLEAGDMRHVAEHIEAFPDDEHELTFAAKDVNKAKELSKARKELAHQRLEENRAEIKARGVVGIPEGYTIDDDGIKYMHATEEGIKEILVTPTKLTITKRYRLVESGEEFLEISWPSSKRTLLKSILFDTHKIIKLASYGPSITSINARLVVQYLQAYDDCNKAILPTVYVVDKLGDHGKFGWKLGNETIGGDGSLVEYWPDKLNPGTANLSVGVSGSWDMQRQILTGLDQHPKALLCFYASCASPLLSHFRVPGFVVDINGKTSQGKTTAMRIAASVWGCPSGLMQKWNTTETYRERWAAFHNHIPIFLDDHKDRGVGLRYSTDGEHPITSAIYQLSDGIGRGRGT
ncbi:MAG: DUF927 domain-containing protein, partial [Phycisphaeraceae bacterium]|nr:DUF927 domain-containing protein [Phycisphaeraceae bacterium]